MKLDQQVVHLYSVHRPIGILSSLYIYELESAVLASIRTDGY